MCGWAYWDTLRELIDGLAAAGAVVPVEGSRLIIDDADGTADEQNLIAGLRRCDEWEKLRVAGLGLIHQVDGLRYPAHWQIIDLSYLQILRRLGPAAIGKIIEQRTRHFDWPDDNSRRLDRLRLQVAVTMRMLDTDRAVLAQVKRASRSPVDAVLIGERDAIALNGVAGTGRDTVLVWGVIHLPGLGAGLHEQGFRRIGDPEWHTAANQPSNPDSPVAADPPTDPHAGLNRRSETGTPLCDTHRPATGRSMRPDLSI